MVESPCTYECHLIDDHCIRCQRTLWEIKNWVNLTDNEKEQIIQRCSEYL